jgi:hypothetical protein
VDWFLSRFRRRNSGRAALVCYLRENGPIAYGTDVFGTDPRERADAMLSTDLTWYWKTSGPDALTRDWTHLSRWSLAALLEDLGAMAGRLKSQSSSSASREKTRRKTSPIRGSPAGCAASAPRPRAAPCRRQPAGSGRRSLFVAQQPPESIRTMLQAWGSTGPPNGGSYARLHGTALEDPIRSSPVDLDAARDCGRIRSKAFYPWPKGFSPTRRP